ncbi:hypothetical protein THOM_3222 [Trachipleistophora hominis]|uniref:Uncharacterized protein n=1 Tax=Trachipleistophora hominis TaxID=72359 RepID=L7JSX7_TRAHO|nr:hypothetical protein THOM_3222 [Trachipleistophora hominis]
MPTYFHNTPTCRFYVSSTLAENIENDKSLEIVCNHGAFKHHLEKYFSPLFNYSKCQVVVKIHIFRGNEECFGELVNAVSITILQIGAPIPYFLVGVTLCDANQVYHLVLRNNCRLIGIFGCGKFNKKCLEGIKTRCGEEVEKIRGVLQEIVEKR